MIMKIQRWAAVAAVAGGFTLAGFTSNPDTGGLVRTTYAQTSRPDVQFSFGQIGGFLPGGVFHVFVYSDGSVTLRKQVRTQNVRLMNPKLLLSRQAREGLQTLVEAEGFYNLPAVLQGNSTNRDLPSYSITVKKSTQSKSVKLIRTTNGQFGALYSVLMYSTGVCIYSQSKPQICIPIDV